MEYKKKTKKNLLNNTRNERTTFKTKNWVETNDE